MSLKGKDVHGPDPAPKPEKSTRKQDRETRKRGASKETEDMDGETSSKKPRKGSSISYFNTLQQSGGTLGYVYWLTRKYMLEIRNICMEWWDESYLLLR